MAAACESTVVVRDVGGDIGPPATCEPDPSGIGDSIANPLATTVDGTTEHVDLICPRYDTDIWRVSITGERQLAEIEVNYEKGISPIQLAVNWTGPERLCVPASPDPCPVSCTGPADCPTGACGSDGFCVQGCAEVCTTDANCTVGTCRRTCASSPSTVCTSDADCTGSCNPTGLCSPQGLCDEDRGGCRDPQAAPCADAGDCAGTEQCARAPLESLTTVLEPADALHRIRTNLAAFDPGDYFLEVYDRGNQEDDPNATYTLTVGQRQDPDTNEPNNAQNMATEIWSGDTVTGYFSYVGDVDYYEIDPDTATRPIVEVTVSWPQGTVLEPTWRIEQDGAVVPIPERTTLNDTVGGENLRVQQATWVLPAATPFYVRVDNPTPQTIDLTGDSPYTVSVVVRPDEQEAASRDDQPANATGLDVGDAGTGSNSKTQGIRAENDVDWYHVTRTNSGNEIVLIEASTANGTAATGNCYTNCAMPDCPVCIDGFLLDVTVFYPTGVACSSPTGCNSVQACEESLGQCNCILDQCMIWVERPAPEGLPINGYRQEEGGNNPNDIAVQLPIFGDDLYIQVRHLPTSTLATPGFSASTNYTLTVTHIAEPDGGDATSSPDNNFITRPLMDLTTRSCGYDPPTPANPGKPEFYSQARVVTDAYGDFGGDPAVTGGQGFAVLAQGSQVPMGDCAELTIEGYNDMGNSASPSVTVATTAGALVDNCTDLNALPGPVTLSGGTGTFGLNATAVAAATTATVTTTASGSSIDQPVPIFDTTAPPQLVLDGPRFFYPGMSDTITATLPAAATATVELGVAGGASTTISCHADNVNGELECRDIDNGLMYTTSACAHDTGQASCQVPITAPNSDYGLHMRRDTPGLATMTVTDVAGTIVGATWVAAVYEPPTWSFTSDQPMGYISYEGDSDFWTLTLPDNLPKGELTATLYYNSGSVDLRMAVTRDSSLSGYCPGDCWPSPGCGVSVTSSGSSCAAGCTEPTDSGSCSYVFENENSTIVNIWLNDNNHDDVDTTQAYRFDVSYSAGCPAACLALSNGQYICSQ